MEITETGRILMRETIGHKLGFGLVAVMLVVSVTTCSSRANKERENEIVSFMLDFIVQQEIGGTADYIENSTQPWVDAPPEANIIIWAPKKANPERSSHPLNADKPIKVWWYADNQLVEARHKRAAIEQYVNDYMEHPSSNIWAWGYHEFGIMSVAKDGQMAEVYVGVSCGPLCGHGYFYTLQRSASGQWMIIDAQRAWVS
jgi:hypothetical protein